MKKLLLLWSVFVLSILAFKPAHQKTESNLSFEDDWVELINGKDFTGWKASENTSTWSVRDGLFEAIGKRSHLFYEGEYLKDGFKNFELEVQVKTFRLCNSGIYFHTVYHEAVMPGTP